MDKEKDHTANRAYEAKVSSRGQVTVPIQVRKALGLRTGDVVRFRNTAGGYLITKAMPQSPFDDYVGYLVGPGKTLETNAMIASMRGPGPEDPSP